MTNPYYPLNRDVIKRIVSVYVDDDHEANELTEEILVRQVTVERCGHGNVDPHIVMYPDGTPFHGCPGAGLET